MDPSMITLSCIPPLIFKQRKSWFSFITEPMTIYFLFIRSFFVTEKSQIFWIKTILPLTSAFFLVLNSYFPTLFNFFTLSYCYLACGANLMAYDYLCVMIAQNTLGNTETPLLCYATIVSLKKSPNILKRYIGTKVAFGLIIGKTPMTSTGRATIVVGVCSGASWLMNEHFNRKALDRRAEQDRITQNQRAEQDRAAENQRAEQDRAAENQRAIDARVFQIQQDEKLRAYENYKYARDSYHNKYRALRKGSEPKWSETNYKEWL